jgi:Na+/proline symporter
LAFATGIAEFVPRTISTNTSAAIRTAFLAGAVWNADLFALAVAAEIAFLADATGENLAIASTLDGDLALATFAAHF